MRKHWQLWSRHGGLAALTVLIVLACPASAAPGDDLIRPGMWQIVSRMQIPNNPQMHPEARHTHCFTKDEVAGINARSAALMTTTVTVPEGQKCAVNDLKYAGDKGTWTASCENGESVHVELTFHGDAFEGFVSTGAGDDAVRADMTAKRTGVCE